MSLSEQQRNLLRLIPSIDSILENAKHKPCFANIPKSVLLQSARSVVEDLRTAIFHGDKNINDKKLHLNLMLDKVKDSVKNITKLNLKRIINATGIIVHTNLGRSLLPTDAVENLSEIATRYSNLEFNLSKGIRGSRYSSVEDILCEISHAEAAMVVNNNAAAVLLCLETIAKGKKVLVSRGELVEIGGSFRIPDVIAKSGVILKEVGTTNRTYMRDYEKAIENDTFLLLKVHKSNYKVVGFTADVPLKEMVELGGKYNIPVMEDLGSGTFIDFSQYGIPKEPTVQESVLAGVDIITFSGDKLLGGPQAGIIVGKKAIVDQIKHNPLTRALRIDKLTLAALESTLRLYRNPEKANENIPTLKMLTLPLAYIEKKGEKLLDMLKKIKNSNMFIKLFRLPSRVGGGSLPLLELPSVCVGIKINETSVNNVEKYMRENTPPIIGRIEKDYFIMDLRTINDDELSIIVSALQKTQIGRSYND